MVEVAVSGGSIDPARSWLARILDRCFENLVAEGERRVLWLPALFGLGIALYFLLPFEPPLPLSAGLAALSALLVIASRRNPLSREAALALAAAACGFALADWNAWQRSTPMLQRRIGPVLVTGRVVDIDQRDKGWSVIVVPDPLAELAAGEQPPRIRLHIPARSDELAPGQRIRAKAMLYPVPGQTLPSGRDL